MSGTKVLGVCLGLKDLVSNVKVSGSASIDTGISIEDLGTGIKVLLSLVSIDMGKY